MSQTISMLNHSFSPSPVMQQMELGENYQPTQPTVFCCVCGTSIVANPSGKCVFCITNGIDITDGIERHSVLPFCRHCGRYQRPPWLKCEWESKELLALCLKRINGLQALKDVLLVNATFLYTEPHSRRIKIQLTLQKEYVSGAVVEHNCIVEFVIQPTQCDDCKRAFTPHTWTTVVQIRQKAEHKRSLMYLEQVIIKHNAHENTLRLVEAPDGLDAEFGSKSSAEKFADFVSSNLLTRIKTSRQLVSHDCKSNTAFHKSTISIEVCPICKDDLIYLSPRLRNTIYGGISPFLLCTGATTRLKLVDPFSSRELTIAESKFWKNPFSSVLTRRHLTQFLVLDIQPHDSHTRTNSEIKKLRRKCSMKSKISSAQPMDIDSGKDSPRNRNTSRPLNKSFLLADIEIARISDFGVNDKRFNVRTHLGNILHIGDHCLGYDLSTLNLGGCDDESGLHDKLPCEVILVRKVQKRSMTSRPWVLKRLPITKMVHSEQADSRETMDLEHFKCDIEEDESLRKEINLYKKSRDPSTLSGEEEDTTVCNMLLDLTLEDAGCTFV